MINVDGHIFPDFITSKTEGASKLVIFNEQGENLTKLYNIETIDVTTGLGTVFILKFGKIHRRPMHFGKVTLKLKL